MEGFDLLFRNDTFENWKENGTIPLKNEIVIIKYKNGTYRVCCGDGITPGYKLPKMKKFPMWLFYNGARFFAHFEPFKKQPGKTYFQDRARYYEQYHR